MSLERSQPDSSDDENYCSSDNDEDYVPYSPKHYKHSSSAPTHSQKQYKNSSSGNEINDFFLKCKTAFVEYQKQYKTNLLQPEVGENSDFERSTRVLAERYEVKLLGNILRDYLRKIIDHKPRMRKNPTLNEAQSIVTTAIQNAILSYNNSQSISTIAEEFKKLKGKDSLGEGISEWVRLFMSRADRADQRRHKTPKEGNGSTISTLKEYLDLLSTRKPEGLSNDDKLLMQCALCHLIYKTGESETDKIIALYPDILKDLPTSLQKICTRFSSEFMNKPFTDFIPILLTSTSSREITLKRKNSFDNSSLVSSPKRSGSSFLNSEQGDRLGIPGNQEVFTIPTAPSDEDEEFKGLDFEPCGSNCASPGYLLNHLEITTPFCVGNER